MPEEDVVQEISQEQIDAQVARSNYEISLGEDMDFLDKCPQFTRIFQEKFIDAWSITNTMNMASTNDADRKRIYEKMISRGHFSDFCESIRIDAKIAKENMREFELYMKEVTEVQKVEESFSEDNA